MEFLGETAEVEELCGFEISWRVVIPAKQKYALISGYTFDSALKTIQNMMKHDSKGDWRWNWVIRVWSKNATITWTCRGQELPCSIYTVIPVGMTGLLTKLQTAAGRCWESGPAPARDHFQLKNTDFKSRDFDVNVSYSGKWVVYILLTKGLFAMDLHSGSYV